MRNVKLEMGMKTQLWNFPVDIVTYLQMGITIIYAYRYFTMVEYIRWITSPISGYS